MRLPHQISPAAAARRSRLADVVAALVLALIAIVLCAGLGIVAVLALVTLALIAFWAGGEAVARRLRRR